MCRMEILVLLLMPLSATPIEGSFLRMISGMRRIFERYKTSRSPVVPSFLPGIRKVARSGRFSSHRRNLAQLENCALLLMIFLQKIVDKV